MSDEQRHEGRDHNLNELFMTLREFKAEIMDIVRRQGAEFSELSTAFREHMNREEEVVRNHTNAISDLKESVRESVAELTGTVEGLSSLVKAFPHVDDGTGEKIPDLHGHRRYHEGLIDEASNSSKFWQSIKEQVGKNIVTGLMFLLLLGFNAYILSVSSKAETERKTEVAAQSVDTEKLIERAVKAALEAHGK